MRQCDTNIDLKINIGQHDLYVIGLVILLNSFKIIWWVNIIVGILDQCDKYMWVSDLYFMVQWFCLLHILKTIGGEMLYLG